MSEHAPNPHVMAGEPHGHAHGITPHHAHPENHFTAMEWANFRAEDFAAGKAVVLVMLSIFTTGVILYSIVAYTVVF